jgi:hypothetical protein
MDTVLPDFNLDVSWLKTLSNNESSLLYEKEPMPDISISFVFVNLNNEIHKIVAEKYDLELDEEEEGGDAFLSKEDILSIVSKKIKFENSHYRLFDLFLFNVDLEPCELSSFSVSRSFIVNKNILEDIVVPCSVPIFHSLNSLFVVLREIDVLKKPSLKISSSVVDFAPDTFVSSHSKTHKSRSPVVSQPLLSKHVKTRKHKKI